MDNTTIEKLVWVFIYAGMAVFGLGVWFIEHSLAVGSTLLVFGGAAMAAGVVLIWLRSKRN
ncbi:MAG: hypothetical protein ABIR94_08975 [Rubrivivax sp.]